MNIWALKKDIPLKLLLLKLRQRSSNFNWNLKTNEENFQAIELFTPNNPDLSTYIYTFGQNLNSYRVNLKYPIAIHNIVGKNENLSLDQTLNIIEIYLFY